MLNRAFQIAFRGTVESRDLAIPLLKNPADTVLVERGVPRLLMMRCPCGCGDDLLVNLDRRVGPAWRIYRSVNSLTLFPSYWRDGGCESHFILWGNKVYWCHGDNDEEAGHEWKVPREMEASVLASLPPSDFIKYDELADQLNLIPWDVLQACQQLSRRGAAMAGSGKQRGYFRKAPKLLEPSRERSV
jgi:hypothetical protein